MVWFRGCFLIVPRPVPQTGFAAKCEKVLESSSGIELYITCSTSRPANSSFCFKLATWTWAADEGFRAKFEAYQGISTFHEEYNLSFLLEVWSSIYNDVKLKTLGTIVFFSSPGGKIMAYFSEAAHSFLMLVPICLVEGLSSFFQITDHTLKPNTQMISLPPAGWVIFHFSVNADRCWGTSGLTRTTKPRGCHSDCWGILLYILSIENLWPECSALYGYNQLENSVFADSSVRSHKEGWVKSALWAQVLEEAARDARLTSLLHTFQKSKKW